MIENEGIIHVATEIMKEVAGIKHYKSYKETTIFLQYCSDKYSKGTVVNGHGSLLMKGYLKSQGRDPLHSLG